MNPALTDLKHLIDVIWFQNTVPGQFFVLFLFIIFFIAAGLSLRHTKRYQDYETQNLKTVEAKFTRIMEHSEPTTNAESKDGKEEKRTPGMVSIDDLRSGVPEDSLIGDRLKLLSQLRRAEVKVNPVTLQEMTRSRESSRWGLIFPSFAVNILLVVGLLGTFVGLAIMIQDISLDELLPQGVAGMQKEVSQLSPSDERSNGGVELLKKKLFVQLTGILHGMRTKFSTTLVGLTCAILCSFLNFRLAHTQAAFIDRLERFTNVELLPRTIPAVEGETLMEKISLQLEGNFSQLRDLAERHTAVSIEIDEVQKAFKEILNNIRQTTKTETPERLQGLLGQMTTVIQQVSNVHLSVKELSEKLPSSLDQIVKRIERNTQKLERSSSTQSPDTPSQLPRSIKVAVIAVVGVIVFISLMKMLGVF